MRLHDWTEADEVIEEVHQARRQSWAELGNDPERLIAHSTEVDKEYAGRMIDTSKPTEQGKSAA